MKSRKPFPPSRCKKALPGVCFILALSLIAVLSRAQARSELSPVLQRQLGIQRLAEEATFPGIYHAQANALYDACTLPKSESDSDTLIRAFIATARSLDSSHLNSAYLNRKVGFLRAESLARFKTKYRPSPILGDPELFRKLRVLSNLDTGSFLEDASAGGLHDSLIAPLKCLRDTLRAHTSRYRRDFELAVVPGKNYVQSASKAPSTLPILFIKLDPNILDHLLLAERMNLVDKLALVWTHPEFSTFLAERELEDLMARIFEDSIRSRITAPKNPILMHKLKGMLHDAVWVDPSRKRINLSGYLFGKQYRLIAADSVLIQASLDAFGEKHARLARRIDAGKSETWDTPEFHELEALANGEAAKIRSSLSAPFKDFLDYRAPANVEMDIHGSSYPDFFSSYQLFQSFRTVLAAIPIQNKEQRLGRLNTLYPDLPREMLLVCASADGKDTYSECYRNWRSSRSVSELNALRLNLGPILMTRFKGSVDLLKKVIILKATI